MEKQSVRIVYTFNIKQFDTGVFLRIKILIHKLQSLQRLYHCGDGADGGLLPVWKKCVQHLAHHFRDMAVCPWNSEEGQREFAAWQAEQAHHANNEKQEVPSGGELPAVHIAIVCGFNRKFYKQCNSQQLVCDMQFTVVANESNRELRWQGASAGAHPVFVLYLIF